MSGRNAIAREVPAGTLPSQMSAGDYYFVEKNGIVGPVGIVHACPCNCGSLSTLMFAGSGTGHPEWDIQEPFPQATLAPSIGIRKDNGSTFHWHGYLHRGLFLEA